MIVVQYYVATWYSIKYKISNSSLTFLTLSAQQDFLNMGRFCVFSSCPVASLLPFIALYIRASWMLGLLLISGWSKSKGRFSLVAEMSAGLLARLILFTCLPPRCSALPVQTRWVKTSTVLVLSILVLSGFCFQQVINIARTSRK